MTIYRLEPAGEFAEGRHLSENSMGGVAAGQSTQGNSGRAAALGWCGLRLTHRISGNLARDRASSRVTRRGCWKQLMEKTLRFSGAYPSFVAATRGAGKSIGCGSLESVRQSCLLIRLR